MTKTGKWLRKFEDNRWIFEAEELRKKLYDRASEEIAEMDRIDKTKHMRN